LRPWQKRMIAAPGGALYRCCVGKTPPLLF
jgi:hypothetical protein